MKPYQHAEAFCFMLYVAEDYTEAEILWNSRDGVTPFCIPSRRGKMMRHVDWRSDKRAARHVPEIGDRIFVDLTLARARESRRAFVDRYWDDPEHCLREHYPGSSKVELVERFAREDLSPGGQPDIVEVTAELRAIFLEQRGRHG